ncbi:hypothetical protein ACHAXT_005638 [Thalassiosira profunda]
MSARAAGLVLMFLGLARKTSASLRSRPGFVSLRRPLAVRTSTRTKPPSQNVHIDAHLLPFGSSGGRIRHHSFLRSGVPSANVHTDSSPSNDTEELEPSFTWDTMVQLFRSPESSGDNNFIPSDHPNLALFRRSLAGNASYLKHKEYLDACWRNAYDYLVVSKFGEKFGFRAVVCNKDGGGVINPVDEDGYQINKNGIPPEGYLYRASPSLAEASKQTIGEGITYLKLVQNDFPYDVAEGIEHWCLWKIGGKSQTEGILRGELAWALRGLEGLEADGKSGIGCIVDRAGEELLFGTPEPPQPASIRDTLMWVNPPHLQSMPEIHHAHILVLRSEADGQREDPTNCPPPI